MSKKISSTQHAPPVVFDAAPSCGKFPLSVGAGGALRAGFPTGDPAGVVDLAFDLGTSPHGLSVYSCPVSTMATVVHLHLPVDAFDVDVDVEPADLPKVFNFSLTAEQRSCLSFAALCEAESLAQCYEVNEFEVQEAIRSLLEARGILEGAQGRSA